MGLFYERSLWLVFGYDWRVPSPIRYRNRDCSRGTDTACAETVWRTRDDYLRDRLQFFGFCPLTALGAVVTPALQGLMSQRAGDDQQGELQGVISSAKSVAMIFSPLAMTQIFWIYTDSPGLYFPGAAFALSGSIMIVCLIVFLGGRRATAT